jgi:hypothetical protein
MHRANLWNKVVTRAEYDAHARETHRQLQRLERLLVRRRVATVRQDRLRRRILGLAISVVAPSQDESAGSPSDRRPHGTMVAVPAEMVLWGLRPV